MSFRTIVFAIAIFVLGSFPPSDAAEGDEETAVLALANEALALISAEDFVGLSELMIEEAVMYRTVFRDGGYDVRARSYAEQRDATLQVDIVERGFDATVLVSGPVAMVWYPYDLYVDGSWSHCGVDIFSLVRTDEGWRMSSMSWSVEQPPACQAHPDGPP